MAKKNRPGRMLLAFFLAMAVLYGLAALTGTWQPRLGLDLEGGTRITLTAINHNVSATKLEQARQIIDSRVNGSGVAEAAVTVQGNKNIIVEIPGQNRKDLLDAVRRTAQLRFRIVATGSPQPGLPVTSTPSPSATPSGTPSGKASPSGTATPTPPATAGTSTATPKPRPAPDVDVKAETSPSPTPTAGSTPAPAPSTTAKPTPASSVPDGSDVAKTIAWAQSPDTASLQALAQHVCPAKGSDAPPIADDPKKPLVACDDKGAKFLLSPAIIEGTQLKTASYGTPPQGTGWAVDLRFKSDARKTFADATRALFNNGGQFAIVLDGVVISYAGVNEPILDGNAQITGSFSEAEARSLANSLKYGALPIRFGPDPTVETIGPSLAGNQLSAGVLAGVIGLIIVMLYCLLYYRGLGIVVIASLFVAAGVTYATVLVLAKAAGFTLTLPGIAGLIVAVGITADSFIVYFERIRDEMREGRSMRVAVEAGWVRAWRTCLAADAVSFLAALVLYIFAIGVVRGFAFALGISTIIDVLVFFFFTKPMVTLLARRSFFNTGHRLSGLSPETLGVDRPAVAGGKA